MPFSFSGCGSRTCRVAQGEMPADAAAVGNRRGDEIFTEFHRVRQGVAPGQGGDDRGGIGAAGAVGGNAFDEGSGEQQLGFAIEENINRRAAIFQMAALQQDRTAVARMDFPGGGAHLFRVGNFRADQYLRLVQIGRDEGGEGEELFPETFFGRRLEQARAAGGHHHRVNHERTGPRLEEFGDERNVSG